MENFQGKRVHRVTGALVIDSTPPGSIPVRRITGNHELTLLYNAAGGPVFIRDRLEDTYDFRNGDEIRYRGFINHWISYPDTEKTVLERIEEFDLGNIEDVTRVETEEGPALRLNNLRFRPDLAELLPDEEGRLDRIAETLRSRTTGTILVVGHAAATGNPQGETRLSRERARTITGELMARGVDPARLIYEGRGSSEPIASNDTEKGRSRNRRVEIILIEE
jgi:outer membrane protein OmpA-like peptidoglycan-associated protein